MRKALVVGIDDYPGVPLKGCVNDAVAMTALLERNGDGSPDFSVRLLTSPKAVVGRSQLRRAIEELFAGDDEVCLFYFSGHGLVKSTGGYIVTSDVQKHDEGISMDDILNLANGSHAKDRIVLLDCCHSGAFGSPAITSGTIAQLRDGLTVLSATREHEAAVEIRGGGLFTSLVLEALKGGAADLRGEVSPGGVYAYIDRALGPWEQRPVFKTNVSRFTSLRTVAAPIPLQTLRKLCDYFPDPDSEFKLDPSYEFTEKRATPEHVAVFKDLQKFESVGLVVPVGEEHMYFAAINSKSCRLTALGTHYWRLVKEKKI